MDEAARGLVLGAILPLWIAAGFLDWRCHRATRIESTGGLPESLFHWLLFAEMGAGVVAVLFCEADGAVIGIVLGAFAAHEFTVWRELRYAAPRREIRPVEQMIHSFLEVLPLALVAVLAMQAAANGTWTDFGLRPLAQPWPAEALLALGAGVLLFNVLPFAEETWRCLRARAGS